MPTYLIALGGPVTGYLRWTVGQGKGPSDAVQEVKEFLKNNQFDMDRSCVATGADSLKYPVANPTQPLNILDFVLKQNGGNRKE